jgi:hypothetical protein
MKQPSVGRAWGRALAALAAAAALSSCGGNTTTTPTPTTVIDTFNGTLAALGSVQFPFNVTTAGVVSATLTVLNPQSTITVGFGLGQPSAGVCNLISGAYSEAAKVGTPISGTINAGSYCVVLYDIGNVVGSDDFTITISHS